MELCSFSALVLIKLQTHHMTSTFIEITQHTIENVPNKIKNTTPETHLNRGNMLSTVPPLSVISSSVRKDKESICFWYQLKINMLIGTMLYVCFSSWLISTLAI